MSDIKLNIDFNKINKEAEDLVTKKVNSEIKDTISNILLDYFATRNGYRLGFKDGIGTKFIRDKIEDLICSEKSTLVIEKMIEEKWEEILKETTIKALQHKANKLVFNNKGIKSNV